MAPHAPQADPSATLLQMLNGKLVSRAVSLVADLAIADHLAMGARTVEDLARSTETDAAALYRVLRLLSRLGVFHEEEGGRFSNSPTSDRLRSDAEGSMRPYARWLGTGFHWQTTTDMDHSIRTGESSIRKRHPDSEPFEVLASHPSEQRIFQQAMTGLSRGQARHVVEAYDFSRYGRIVDVGGGHGFMATAIARAAPNAEVTILDLPHVAAGARELIEEEGLGDRVRAVGGSFFEEVPGPADLCIMKFVLHDWDDDHAVQILDRSRETLTAGGRLLVAEMLITDGPEAIPALTLDLEMLIGPGGRERTEAEFRDLFERARLELTDTISTPGPIRLLEGERA